MSNVKILILSLAALITLVVCNPIFNDTPKEIFTAWYWYTAGLITYKYLWGEFDE